MKAFLRVTFGLLFVVSIYLLPTGVAMLRKRTPSKGSIAVLNVFLGWSVIAWVIALAMALRTAPEPAYVIETEHGWSEHAVGYLPPEPPDRPDNV